MGLRPATCFIAAAVAATALGIGPGGQKASACGFDCGRYAPAYYAPYGPPAYGYAVPVTVYAPPPPRFAYAYAPAYPAYAPPYRVNYYTTRVTVVRRPRRAYRAARWRPRAYRGGCRRVRVCGRRGPRWRRAYVRGGRRW